MQPLLSFFLVITIARVLKASGLGAYSFILSFLLIFQVISSLGLGNLIAREVAKDTLLAAKYYSNSSVIGIVLAVILQIVMVLIAHILALDNQIVTAMYIVSFTLLASALIGCFEGILTGLEKIHFIAYNQIIENVLKVSLSILLLLSGYGLKSLMIVILAMRYLALSLIFIFVIKHITNFRFEVDYTFCKTLIDKAKTFALIMIFVTIYWKLDLIMLTKMKGSEAAGIYSAAYRILQLVMILPRSFVTSIFPVISNFFESAYPSFVNVCEKAIRYMFLFTIPVATGITLLSKPIILNIYGIEFSNSMPILSILIWTLIPYGVTLIFAYALVASNNQKVDLRVNGISLLSNGILNFILIPRFSFLGAAIATLLSIFVYLGLQYPFVSKKLFTINYKKIFEKPLIASFLMGMTIFYCKELHFLVVITIASSVYFLTLLFLKAFSKEELDFIIDIWNKTIYKNKLNHF